MYSPYKLIRILIVGFGICDQLILSSANRNYSDVDDSKHADDELIFVQILYRHGNRTPVLSYPSDPYFNREYFPEGFGNLTDAGKELHFNLGRYFRERYKSLLGDSFSPDKVYVRSTAEDRALESAKFNSAGLFSPSGNQTWRDIQKNQIIPIHTVPFDEDNLLYPITCAKVDKQQEEFLESDEIKKLLQKFSGLRKYMRENSGLQIDTLLDWVVLHDALSIESKRGLTLPFWAQNVLKTSNDALIYIKGILFESYTPTTEARKIRSGFLLKEILERFKNKTMDFSNTKQAMYIYSGHDVTIANTLSWLNVYDYGEVSFGASLLFELHRSGGEYYVEIFHRNGDAEPIPVIIIPNCGNKCSLNKMFELYTDVLPRANDTFESLCRL